MEPVQVDSEDVLALTRRWRAAGKKVALATVVSTWGSSPRPAGSRLAVNEDMEFAGSVSGGCIESAVVKEALAVMASSEPRVLEFGVSNESAWQVGLACGGTIRVLVEPVTGAVEALLDEIERARERGEPVVLVVDLEPGPGRGAHRLVYPFADSAGVDEELLRAVRDAAESDRCAVFVLGSAELFLHVHNPRLRLIVVGAVHIAQALCPMAALAGFAVTVVDPRTAFATPARFPGVELCTEWPDAALAGFLPDRRTAVVTLTHDPKLDEPALVAALGSKAFYIGALGSKKTQAARLARLREQGLCEAELARICGPAGLDIGSKSAAEIAVSILAQIIEHLRRPKRAAGAMNDR